MGLVCGGLQFTSSSPSCPKFLLIVHILICGRQLLNKPAASVPLSPLGHTCGASTPPFHVCFPPPTPLISGPLLTLFSLLKGPVPEGGGEFKFFLRSVSAVLLPASLVPCHAPLPEPHLIKDLLGGPGEARREGDPRQITAGLGGHKPEGPQSLTTPQMNKSQSNQLLSALTSRDRLPLTAISANLEGSNNHQEHRSKRLPCFWGQEKG